MARLGEVCEINPKMPSFNDETLVSFVTMSDVSENGQINTSITRLYGEVKKGFTCFQEGDVLFAKITPCMENGKGALAIGLKNGIGCGSTEFHVLRSNPHVLDNRWLYYLTAHSAFRKEAERHMTGSAGQKRVPKSFLEKHEFTVPSLDEQRQHVKTLDLLENTIDLRKKQLQKLDDLVKSRFVEMFDAGSPSKCKMYIHDYADVISGFAFSSEDFCENEIPIVRISNINNGKVSLDSSICFPRDFWESNRRYRVLQGDVLMAMSGATTGKAGINTYSGPLLLNQRVACIRAKQMVSTSEFLFVATQLPWMYNLIQEASAGCAQPNISGKQIENMPIPAADYEKQKEFSVFANQIENLKLTVQPGLDKLELLKQSLMQKYFG